MDIVGAVFADFVQAPAGGPSQLRTEIAGRTILTRTLRRVTQIRGLARRCLFVRPRDQAPAEQVLRSTGLADQFDLVPLDTASRGRRLLLTAGRKWNLEAWRGSPLGTTWFDEFVDPAAVAQVINHYKCDGVFCIDGHQPLLDPAIASAMRVNLDETREEAKMSFTQAPPGLAGIILRREAVQDLLEVEIPLGLALSYRPELAQTDPIIHSACYHVPSEVTETATRLTGDTRRSRELLTALVRDLGEDADAVAVCRWVAAPGHDRAGPLPVEVELELTTSDPLPNTTLRPRGQRVPPRQVSDLKHITRLAEQLAEYDDRLIFLAGHGDPLQHPQFAAVCEILHAAGTYGVGVGTPLVDLTDENFAALFAHGVDLIEVYVDAHSPETYRLVHGSDAFTQTRSNIERIEQARRERHSPQPLVACALTRCAATSAELEPFFDEWIRATGTAVIHGYNEFCGILPPDTLLSTTSPLREPCRRVATRLTLLADGTAVACAQDVRGEVRLGDWTTEPLRDLWAGSRLTELRQSHSTLGLERYPLCLRCREWGRP